MCNLRLQSLDRLCNYRLHISDGKENVGNLNL